MSDDEVEMAAFNPGFSFDFGGPAKPTNNATAANSSTGKAEEPSFRPSTVDEKIARVRRELREAEAKKKEAASGANAKSKKKNRKKRAREDDDAAPAGKKLKKVVPEGTDTGVGFHTLRLSSSLVRATMRAGWAKTTPVQTMAIPLALAGHDILGCAKTGSGKTGAFLLPILERLLHRPSRQRVSRVLILSPTRELATQIYKTGVEIASFTDVEFCFVVGGLSMHNQLHALQARPDVIVATPGRMIDHLRNSKGIHLDDLEILVLDEADRLLDMGFKDEVLEMVRALPRMRQTMLFSATLSAGVEKLSELALKHPKRVTVDRGGKVADNLDQEFIRIRGKLVDKQEAVLLHLCRTRFKNRTMVFADRRKEVHRLTIIFGLAGLKAVELSGSLTQVQRLAALEKFREGRATHLVCTNLAARGLDIEGVFAVLNMSVPKDIKTYIHRVGRTGRAGRRGISVTLVTEVQRKLQSKIVKATKGGRVKNANVDFDEVGKVNEEIVNMSEGIQDVLSQEYAEKTLKMIEMKETKLTNLAVHRKEIMSRPKKTWFRTEKQKQENRDEWRAAQDGKRTEAKERLAKAKKRKAHERELAISKGGKQQFRKPKRETMAELEELPKPSKKKKTKKKKDKEAGRPASNYIFEKKVDRVEKLGKKFASKFMKQPKPFKAKRKRQLKKHKGRRR